MASKSPVASSMIVPEVGQDVEAQHPVTRRASHWQWVIDQIHITEEVQNYPYRGSGTTEDPYVVEYIPNDPRDPMLLPTWKKWMITLVVSFVSSILAL